MENWGLITYRETSILYNQTESSSVAHQWVAVVVAHELAHQVGMVAQHDYVICVNTESLLTVTGIGFNKNVSFFSYVSNSLLESCLLSSGLGTW